MAVSNMYLCVISHDIKTMQGRLLKIVIIDAIRMVINNSKKSNKQISPVQPVKSEVLTHWSLWVLNKVLEMLFLSYFSWLMAAISLLELDLTDD